MAKLLNLFLQATQTCRGLLDRLARIVATMALVFVGISVMGYAVGAAGSTQDRPGPRYEEEESSRNQTLRRRQHVMGTWLDVTIRAHNREQALAATEAALEAIAEVDRRLSTWRPDSELAEVNHILSDRPVHISVQLARDLSEVMRWYRVTDGAFSPGLGSLISAWDLRGEGRVPTATELRTALAASAISGLLLNNGELRANLAGLQIEEGGFGKGAALRQALAAARANGALCTVLDFGGHIAVNGACGATIVGISHPDARHNEVALLELGNGSVATSGQSQRGFVIDGERFGHVLDPRSGMPVEDWGSVTVIATDPLDADCGATALYVMGPESGVRWAADQPNIEAVFTEKTEAGVRLRATTGLKGRLSTAGGHVIEWVETTEGRRHTIHDLTAPIEVKSEKQ